MLLCVLMRWCSKVFGVALHLFSVAWFDHLEVICQIFYFQSNWDFPSTLYIPYVQVKTHEVTWHEFSLRHTPVPAFTRGWLPNSIWLVVWIAPSLLARSSLCLALPTEDELDRFTSLSWVDLARLLAEPPVLWYPNAWESWLLVSWLDRGLKLIQRSELLL